MLQSNLTCRYTLLSLGPNLNIKAKSMGHQFLNSLILIKNWLAFFIPFLRLLEIYLVGNVPVQ